MKTRGKPMLHSSGEHEFEMRFDVEWWRRCLGIYAEGQGSRQALPISSKTLIGHIRGEL